MTFVLHASSSKQAQTLPISPHRPSFHLYAGGTPNLVNESSQTHTKTNITLTLEKGLSFLHKYAEANWSNTLL